MKTLDTKIGIMKIYKSSIIIKGQTFFFPINNFSNPDHLSEISLKFVNIIESAYKKGGNDKIKKIHKIFGINK